MSAIAYLIVVGWGIKWVAYAAEAAATKPFCENCQKYMKVKEVRWYKEVSAPMLLELVREQGFPYLSDLKDCRLDDLDEDTVFTTLEILTCPSNKKTCNGFVNVSSGGDEGRHGVVSADTLHALLESLGPGNRFRI